MLRRRPRQFRGLARAIPFVLATDRGMTFCGAALDDGVATLAALYATGDGDQLVLLREDGVTLVDVEEKFGKRGKHAAWKDIRSLDLHGGTIPGIAIASKPLRGEWDFVGSQDSMLKELLAAQAAVDAHLPK